jgi:cation transport ATPase
MPDSAQSNPWLRVARQIVAPTIFVVSFTLLGFRSGVHWWYLLWIGCFGLVMVVQCCRKGTARQGIEHQTTKSRSRLAWQFVGAMLYIAVVSLLFAEFTDRAFWIVFAAVVSGAIFTGTVILTWATLWALRKDTRKNQFSIQTLLFLMTISAVCLGVARLLADLVGDRLGTGGASLLSVTIFCLVLTVLSLPLLALTMESLVWFAAWLVRKPWVQRWLKTPQSTGNSPLRVEEDEESGLQ